MTVESGAALSYQPTVAVERVEMAFKCAIDVLFNAALE